MKNLKKNILFLSGRKMSATKDPEQPDVPEVPDVDDEDDLPTPPIPPDGGWGWVIVFASL